MVVGLLRNASDASACLDNLYEAEFQPGDISLVMQTKRGVEAIANVAGPLNEVPAEDLPARLVALGLPPAAAALYRIGVERGEVFIAITAPEGEEAAEEMLHDHRAEAVLRFQTPAPGGANVG